MSEDLMSSVKSLPDGKWPKYLSVSFENREWTFSPMVKERAQEFLSEGRVYEANGEGRYLIHSTSTKVYSVSIGRDTETNRLLWITCGCAHGSRQGWGRARCSHALSVLLALKAKMKLPTRLSPKAEKIVRERLAKEAKK